jgi:hypothetical protein
MAFSFVAGWLVRRHVISGSGTWLALVGSCKQTSGSGASASGLPAELLLEDLGGVLECVLDSRPQGGLTADPELHELTVNTLVLLDCPCSMV